MKNIYLFVVFSACTCVQKVHTMNHTATVGQDVRIPCGINSVENVTRLVWKTGQSASDSEELAYSFESNVVCDKSQKDCDLKDNGDLVIHNVKEVDSIDKYFCFLDDEQYYAEHTLNILPTASPPNFENCPDAVSVSKPDHSSQRLLAYTTPICRNSEDVLGSVTCEPASGTKIDSSLNKVVCNCTYSEGHSVMCEMTIPVLPPSFEDCPVSSGVSVSKLEDSSLMLLAYTTPVCRNPEEVLGIVSCYPKSGAKIDSSYNSVVCNCTYAGDHSDTCEMLIPADRSEPGCAKITGQGFAIGFVVCATLVIVPLVVFIIWHYERNKTSTDESPSANGSPQSSSQNQTACHNERANGTEEHATLLQEFEMTDPIIHTPTDDLDRDAQIAETRQEHGVTQDREQSVIQADGQTIEMTQPHRVQPDLEPLPTQEANIQQEETMPDLGVQPETEPVAIQANIHPEEAMPDHGVHPRTELPAIQENQRPWPISAITVTSPPQFWTPERGYDTVDLPEDATVVAMKELMLDFDSGPQITLLRLKDILSDGMEIRSLPDSRFEVIRKSEERHDVPLTCRKDGHHWDICSGDQFCFYISCGYCRKGCFFVGISGGECKQKGKEID